MRWCTHPSTLICINPPRFISKDNIFFVVFRQFPPRSTCSTSIVAGRIIRFGVRLASQSILRERMLPRYSLDLVLLFFFGVCHRVFGQDADGTDNCESNKYLFLRNPSIPSIEGCYKRGRWISLEDHVWTTEGGEIVDGTTYGILGSFVSRVFPFPLDSDGVFPLYCVYHGSNGRMRCGVNFRADCGLGDFEFSCHTAAHRVFFPCCRHPTEQYPSRAPSTLLNSPHASAYGTQSAPI